MLSGNLGFQRKFNFETIMMEIYSILSCSQKKMLTRGTFVCEIDDISCCQSRPQIDGFHGDVIRLQSQKRVVLRILIHTRLKINRK